MRPETLGRDLAELLDDGAPALTIEEVQQHTVRGEVRPARPASPLTMTVAAFALVVLSGLLIGVLTRPPSTDPAPAAALGGPILPPVQLGTDHLWPPVPTSVTAAELASQFVSESLGWDLSGSTEPPNQDPDGPLWFRIKQAGVEELVDVITVPIDDGYVITEIGPPWFLGVEVRATESNGTKVSMLRIGDGVTGEVTIRLADGTHVVASKTFRIGVSDSDHITLPNVDPDAVRSVLIRYVDEEGKVIAANGASGLSIGTGTSTTLESSSDDETPSLGAPTGSRVYLTTDTQITVVDVDTRSVVVNDLPELAGGDPLHRLVSRESLLAFYGDTGGGPAVFALDPDAPADPVLVDEAWFFIPSAVEDRVWLAILDVSSPDTVRALEAVREVTIDGDVTHEDVRPPDGRWPVADLDAGLVFQGEGILEVWDPNSQVFVETLPGPFPVAVWHNRIVTCSQCDQLTLIDLDASTRRPVELPPEVRSVDGYGGAFSPDGRWSAVTARVSDQGVGVVVIDFEEATATLVPGTTHTLDGYPQVAWSSDGEWLFYNVGGTVPGSGRLYAYRPGDPTAYRVPVTLDGQYYGMAVD